jgi:osomolarity two-component system, response regulator SKN7
VSATSMIRQFDHMTPIISMTSNSKPNEIMTYYHSGMNDILPKPFTKQGLLEMLEVCSISPSFLRELTMMTMTVMHVL